ncbi:hypothetical protein [Methanoculleus sp.]|jgi:hypothetical protein|uniref:hypothetical protein n=1 Tax=Methanoculleus sp. TaxID=90427 RepID=UPI0025EB63A1|nr:hypothetical protein [Methanoculleus sp.]MCK9320345.1 hypothetical protein [Methanoculleus sp.]
MDKQFKLKDSLNFMVNHWYKDSAEKELGSIILKAEDLVRQLKMVDSSDYSPKEKYQSMRNYIDSFVVNIPKGHGCYNLSEAVAVQNFLKKYESEEK